MTEPARSLRDELRPRLISRIRVGSALIGTSIVLYGLLELWQHRAPLGPFFAVKAVQVATLLTVWLLLDRTAPWQRAVALTLALVVEVCVTLAISGILAGEVESAPLLYVLLTLGAAILLPWGLAPQIVTVGVAAASLVANAWWVPVPDGFGYTATAACLGFVASLCVAHELEQQRRQRHRAEMEERDSTSALREEIFLAEASAHAARALLDEAEMATVLSVLCRLETRLLGCEASYSFLRDAHDAKAFVAVAGDGDTNAEWGSRRALRIPDIGLARLLDRLDRDVPVVAGASEGVLPVEGRACIYTALVAGRELIGVQVAVRRRSDPFSATDVELARRLAHTGSAALAQARLRETQIDARTGNTPTGARLWRELQTPLSSILRLAERAGDLSLPTAERRALVARIASTSRDMLRLLENLEGGGVQDPNRSTGA